MGDSGTKRSTLVSRLPIFRRNLSRRKDSLPSSPSSNNTGALPSSSPSSTNSSSGSTGKRRSIFRTPSLSFHHRKDSSNQRFESSQVTDISPTTQNAVKNLDLDEQSKTKVRSCTSIPGSCRKKITRSITEDFERRKDHSANKNLFTNCLGKSEGDDSGFTDDEVTRSVKHSSRKLLPRSFSSHYRFSKHGSQCQRPSSLQASGRTEEVRVHQETDSLLAKPVLSNATEITEHTEKSVQSTLISTDHTTAPQTPSDFTFMDDSASEADSLPNSVNQQSIKQHFYHSVSTSPNAASPNDAATQVNEDKKMIDDNCQRESLSLTKQKAGIAVYRSGSNSSLVCSKQLLPICELSTSDASDVQNGTGEQHIDIPVFHNGGQHYSTECFPKKSESVAYQCDLTPTMPNHHSVPETKGTETQTSLMQHSHTRVNYASSFSPYRDGRYAERRLRSSSEGTAGGSRITFKPKEGNTEEFTHFRKQRTISTSSKMNSMDVLNNLGSCELDEDDLMLDLEFTEEQQLRRVCREDSYQSIVSCSAVVLSHVEQASETNKPKEEAKTETAKRNLFLHLAKENDQEDAKCPRVCQMPNSPSLEWPFAQEDSTSLESLPFRLMMQDCTSVKTLLLKMKRILQESTEMSPASSTASLPISPIAERSLPFKDIMKDECSMLKLQLKERDELIHQLQEELKIARTLQSLHFSKQDKCTQTEFANHEVHRNTTSTEGSIYKAIRPVHCFQHYQFKTNIWTQDALH
ncbi:serine-rich coiled-coil domain-containing protein 1 isoform X2 [Pseudophryne corroboree]|uniref:serine-rich coiled-coil domain-containing protein 1 isoform X2 n=1 Tax=Pseudophryne corroboree TaxID=495146 RepID=UPI003081E1B7